MIMIKFKNRLLSKMERIIKRSLVWMIFSLMRIVRERTLNRSRNQKMWIMRNTFYKDQKVGNKIHLTHLTQRNTETQHQTKPCLMTAI
jgi:hypothetical protein